MFERLRAGFLLVSSLTSCPWCSPLVWSSPVPLSFLSFKVVATTTMLSPLPPAVPGCQDQMSSPPQKHGTLPIHTFRFFLNQDKHYVEAWVPQESYYLHIISASTWRAILFSFYKGSYTNLLLGWAFRDFSAQSKFLSIWIPLGIRFVSFLSHVLPCFYFVVGGWLLCWLPSFLLKSSL